PRGATTRPRWAPSRWSTSPRRSSSRRSGSSTGSRRARGSSSPPTPAAARRRPPGGAAQPSGRGGEPKKLVVLEGYGHYEVYLEPAFGEVMRETLAWYKRSLPPAPGERINARRAHC